MFLLSVAAYAPGQCEVHLIAILLARRNGRPLPALQARFECVEEVIPGDGRSTVAHIGLPRFGDRAAYELWEMKLQAN